MMLKKSIIILLIVMLVAGNAFFIFDYLRTREVRLVAYQEINISEADRRSRKSLEFLIYFVNNVLGDSKKKVDFETRLRLENIVREIDDKEILEQWRQFVESENSEELQQLLVQLLKKLLANIISV